MDHLPWCARSKRQRPVVPFLANYEDICPSTATFEFWAATKGWHFDQEISLITLAERAQGWLYFGLLGAILQDDFTLQQTVSSGVICSADLQNLLARHILQEESNTNRGSATVSALQVAVTAFDERIVPALVRISNSGERVDFWTSAPCRVLFSVSVLLENIYNLLARSDGHQGPIPRQNGAFLYDTPGLATGLQAVGRCPSLLRRLDSDPALAYSLMSFDTRDNGLRHNDCSVDRCKAFDIKEEEYKTQHVSSCHDATCRMHGFTYRAVSDLIEQDYIPLVRSTIDAHGNLSITLEAGTLESKYTAISHVWAGGLGNFKQNSLYGCQLLQIHKDLDKIARLSFLDLLLDATWASDVFATRLAGAHRQETKQKADKASSLFWIDTLCIPIDPSINVASATTDKSRKRAINSMARIYAGAEAVLVLDPEIQQEAVHALTDFEAQLAIACAPYMARSWTLHEAAIAVKLVLRFSDDVKPFSEIKREGQLRQSLVGEIWNQDIMDESHPELPESLVTFGAQEFFGAAVSGYSSHSPRRRTSKEREEKRFVQVWNELSGRGTTKPDDVAAILAALLNLSSGEVLKLERPRDRMKAILKSQRSLPLWLLLSPTLDPDIHPDWTPRFPGAGSSTLKLDSSGGTMEVTEAGLIMSTPPILFALQDANVTPSGGIKVCVNLQEMHYQVSFDPETIDTHDIAPGQLILWFSNMAHSNGRRWGRWFRMANDGVDGLHVGMGNRFLWSDCKGRVDCLEATPLAPRPVIIDIDIASWPDLKWSRTAAFPFVELALGQIRTMDLLPMFFVLGWLIPIVASLTCIYAYFAWKSAGPRDDVLIDEDYLLLTKCSPIRFTMTVALVPGALCLLRGPTALAQYRYLLQTELRWVQETWAASFWDVTAAKGSGPTAASSPDETLADIALERARPKFAVKALLIHTVILLASMTGLVLCFQHFYPAPSWSSPTGGIYWFYPLVVTYANKALLTAATVFFFASTVEMFCCVMVFAAYLYNWHSMFRTAKFGRGSHELGTYLPLAHQLVRVVAWVLYAACFIATFGFLVFAAYNLAHATDEREVLTVGVVFATLLCGLVLWLRLKRALLALGGRCHQMTNKHFSQGGVIVVQLMEMVAKLRDREGRIRLPDDEG